MSAPVPRRSRGAVNVPAADGYHFGDDHPWGPEEQPWVAPPEVLAYGPGYWGPGYWGPGYWGWGPSVGIGLGFGFGRGYWWHGHRGWHGGGFHGGCGSERVPVH